MVLNQCFGDVRELYRLQVSDGNNHKNDYRGDVGKIIRWVQRQIVLLMKLCILVENVAV